MKKVNSKSQSKNWIEVELGDIAEINLRSIGKKYSHKQIEYIDISSVGTGVLFGATKYLFSKAPTRARRLVSDGDTILSTVRPNRRSFYFIKKPKNNLVVSTGFAVLSTKKNIDSRFLYYIVCDQKFSDYLSSNTKGSAYPAVDVKTIKRFKLTIPSFSIQRKIASILSAYDDLIEVNNKKIENLEEIAQAIYNEWFVKFKFPGYEKAKFKNRIPEGWDIKKHGDIIDNIVLGGTPARKKIQYWKNGTIPWIKSGKLNSSRIINGTECIAELGLEKSAAKLMPKRTVLVAITGTILIGISEIEICANQSVVGLYGSKELTQEYIYLYEKSIIDKYIGKMSGSAQQHINKEIIQETDIIVPDAKTIKLFDNIVKPVFDKISIFLFMNENLRKTRDLLLPKLMSGEIIL